MAIWLRDGDEQEPQGELCEEVDMFNGRGSGDLADIGPRSVA
jgi:hypothetical protein